jgi:hypothetical protein
MLKLPHSRISCLQLAVCLLSTLSACFGLSADMQNTRTYEYQRISGLSIDDLNALGKRGWRLVPIETSNRHGDRSSYLERETTPGHSKIIYEYKTAGAESFDPYRESLLNRFSRGLGPEDIGVNTGRWRVIRVERRAPAGDDYLVLERTVVNSGQDEGRLDAAKEDLESDSLPFTVPSQQDSKKGFIGGFFEWIWKIAKTTVGVFVFLASLIVVIGMLSGIYKHKKRKRSSVETSAESPQAPAVQNLASLSKPKDSEGSSALKRSGVSEATKPVRNENKL